MASINDALTKDPNTIWRSLIELKETAEVQIRRENRARPTKWKTRLENLISKDVQTDKGVKTPIGREPATANIKCNIVSY